MGEWGSSANETRNWQIYSDFAQTLIMIAREDYSSIKNIRRFFPCKTSFMEYRESAWRDSGQKRKITQIWVPFSGISPYLVKAIIIAEDAKFWSPAPVSPLTAAPK